MNNDTLLVHFCLSDVPVPQAPQHINNCPPATRIFHGRQAILQKMHQYFKREARMQDIFLLHGLGGAGKTQIGLKFIKESASIFTDIFLIDSSTITTIETGLKNIATTKGVGDSSQSALQWLKSKPEEWLLFFDNADDPKMDLNKYFPQCDHGNIIITSRNPGLCVYAGSHSAVSDIETSDAIDLLLRSAAQATTDPNKAVAAEIVKVLCYLPLAIVQAGAFISKSGRLNGYLALYATNKTRLLSQKPAQSHDSYAWTVYTTWQISFDQLSQQAKTFLQLCSFLHYQGISEDIFRNAAGYKFGPSSPSKEELKMPLDVLSKFLDPSGIWDPLCFLDVTSEIQAYSLITFYSEQNLFSVHPLVHDWTRGTVPDAGQHCCMVAIAGMSLAGLSDTDMAAAGPQMMPHIELLMRGNFNIVPDFRHEYGKAYVWAGELEKAKQLLMAVLEHRRNTLGVHHLDTLEAMHRMASIYSRLGNFQEAEALGVRVLNKRRDVLGETHPDTLESTGNLATILSLMGRLREAEALNLEVLERRRQTLGETHPTTLTIMSNLAVTYNRLGSLQEAQALELKVLERRRKILGHNHPDTLLSMANLAATYNRLGRFREAEVLEVAVLQQRKSSLGENHPDTMRTMNNLAVTYYKLDRLQEAENLGSVVLEKDRSILGANHPHTLLTMGNLAMTYNKLGRFLEAETLLVDALKKQTDALGNNHPETLRMQSKLGSTSNKLERWQEAEDLLVSALEKQKDLLSANHPHLIETMQSLADTYTKLGKLKEAEDLNEALKRLEV
ncbi:P-loop containing nucleoside triphosphate hydrolase protein [Mycena rosella]|uniref:P-loop containing nucleoside triphosphate hydrolase protein n=1 Tax=Mycena rosella TaxID=1033263 RepID=A0AAD7E254_MYCRO|nr:P-loop containing nucleoside triphosphate hydrolase protein [Mycena rosella]